MNKNRQRSSSSLLLLMYSSLLLLLLPSSSAFTTKSHHHAASLSLRQTQFLSPSRRMMSTSRSIAKSNWQMHMGHSHTHDHHHPSETTTKAVKKIPMKRRITRILFAAAVTLLPPLILNQSRSINRMNTALFVLTSTALSFTERLRAEVQGLLLKAQTWKAGFIKHAPPMYFQTDNAADRVTLVGVIINLVLSIGKAIVGITCHSSALIADAGHSLSDLFSDFITLWAVQIARLPPDDDHPYGHGKFEAVGSLFLALTLFGTGISVGAASNSKLLQILQHSSSSSGAAAAVLKLPTWPALLMAALSIGSKEWLYRITRRVGEKLNSQVVIANAWHHRSDAYSSVLALGSIGLAMMGLPAADAAAGILVAGMICMTGAEIFGEAVKQLTDASDELLEQRVKEEILGQEDVLGVERIRTRWMGSKALVDVAITTPVGVSASANKAIENRVRQSLLDLERGVLVDADVRASPQNEVTCPLLTASSIEHHEDTSVTNVEHEAREMLENHDDVASIERCTIRYEDTLNTVVDANIRVDPTQLNRISDVTALASDLRTTLEQSDHIHKANIYLDLNNHQPTITTESMKKKEEEEEASSLQ